ncbi:filamentous hemagglutinin N-terminal domain-containing protein [Calothrix sp. FACHB-1219]|uniref:two-partner secretion domain-containing protein n=1 Tax=Calothrix sp. FACHB-1219 TaxID=2692778 RepID=UPI001689EDAC|nr:filamentous hemagglutinin N-terminal domain-containing protein [Calothrix sp. FACHB-1219]MBD2220355.1 filamentous hemagglutinin N-terminal domain-containing protein [Calothrix sp. FACHB-1219]
MKSVKAQIIPDGTLGAESSVVTSDVIIKGIPSDRIDGGAIRGGNLFHSFQEFNINSGRGAYFTNPSGIENILTRVTGSNVSNILGTLGVLGNANFFFLNPNGIIFGANARLDVNGSFVGTTANSIGFGNQGFFSATNPQPPSDLLTINPSAFFFNQLQGGRIESRSNLQVPNSRSLLLVGGDITINGGGLNAFGGRVELAGLAGDGTVGLNVDANNLSLTVPDDVARADVSLINGAIIDVSAGGGGSISVNARNLEVREGSQLLAGIRSGLGTLEATAGDITIKATDSVLFDNQSFAFNDVNSAGMGNAGNVSLATGSLEILNGSALTSDNFGGQGNGGNVTITTDSLMVLNGGFLSASTFGQGDAGSVKITATDSVKFDGNSYAGSQVGSEAVGDAGGVFITTGSLKITNGAQLNASTRGQGNAGSVTINATDLVKFDGEGKDGRNSGAFSQVSRGAMGNAGDVSITTGFLEVTNGAQVLSRNNGGTGNAGSVTIKAKDTVSLAGLNGNFQPTVGSDVASGGIGNGNDINITANLVIIKDEAIVAASIIAGKGQNGTLARAGNVNITASDQVFVSNNSEVFSEVGITSFGIGGSINITAPEVSLEKGASLITQIRRGGKGQGGDINVTTASLEVTGGSQLFASTFGEGDAGNIKITASDKVSFNGVGSNRLGRNFFINNDEIDSSGIFSTVESRAVGNAGGVYITTGSLEVLNGAVLSADTFGKGNAGSVTIIATDLVKFDGESQDGNISAAYSDVNFGAVGDAGGVSITTGSLEVTNGAVLSASTFGEGDAGSVKITATDSIKFDVNSSAISQASSAAVGNAGGIDISTNTLELLNGSYLSATICSCSPGHAGNVKITATGTVKFNAGSHITSQVSSVAKGRAGGVDISTQSLELLGGSYLSASTFGEGDAGSVKITATDSIKFDDRSYAVSQVESRAVGKAGGVDISTQSLELLGGSFFDASTFGEGDAGSVTINANTFKASNGSKLVSRTSSEFPAGNIILKVKENITLSGSDTGIFANTTEGSTGQGGSIIIDPRTFIIRDGATISANSQGEGIGGDIELAAGFLTLDNGTISAQTRSNTGGNITLNLQDLLLLRNGSQITTTAGNQEFGGDGGNIIINSPFIVAVPKENSDITANAFSGYGGNINIFTQGIFGIEFQARPTQQSGITASSELGISGNVAINTPEVDPAKGLVELPSNLVDPSGQIDNSCRPGSTQSHSSFVATGRGGLPSSATEPLQDTSTLAQWVKPRTTPQNSVKVETEPQAPTATTNSPVSSPTIVEASGWVVDANANIHLVAQAPPVNPSSPWQTSASCPVR